MGTVPIYFPHELPGDFAMRILIAFLLALASAAAFADATHHYQILFEGKRGGAQTTTVRGDGRIVTEFSYRQNGRGPDLHEEIALDGDGLIVDFLRQGQVHLRRAGQRDFQDVGQASDLAGIGGPRQRDTGGRGTLCAGRQYLRGGCRDRARHPAPAESRGRGAPRRRIARREDSRTSRSMRAARPCRSRSMRSAASTCSPDSSG